MLATRKKPTSTKSTPTSNFCLVSAIVMFAAVQKADKSSVKVKAHQQSWISWDQRKAEKNSTHKEEERNLGIDILIKKTYFKSTKTEVLRTIAKESYPWSKIRK